MKTTTPTPFADWQIDVEARAAEQERREAQLASVEPLCGMMDEERTSSVVIEARERLRATSMNGRTKGSRPSEVFDRPLVLTFLSTDCKDLLRRYPKERHFVFLAEASITRVADNQGRSFLVRSKDGRQWVQFNLRPGKRYVLVDHGGFVRSGRRARLREHLGHGPDVSIES